MVYWVIVIPIPVPFFLSVTIMVSSYLRGLPVRGRVSIYVGGILVLALIASSIWAGEIQKLFDDVVNLLYFRL